MGHLEGDCRYQRVLVGASLDERVSGNHPIRVIDLFVDGLDLAGLGFSKVVAEATGRPPYRPGDLLKLYIYGYLNRIRSSRSLEREAGRNIEVQWLIRSLVPSFKTIADFRKDHAQALVGVCRAFIAFCRELSLYGGEILAIDGSKIEAVASRKKVITPKSLGKQLVAIDRKISEYLAAMDAADAQEASVQPVVGDVGAALQQLRARREQISQQAKQMASQGLTQQVTSEPEARLMRTARHGHQVAYNAQTAVDGEHGLIAAFDLTNEGNDQSQLYAMAELGRQALEVEALTVVADTGYSSGEQGELCAAAGITAIVPRPKTVNPKGEKYFSRDAFRYDAASDSWECPAGQTLTCRQVSQSEQQKKYWTNACAGCPLKGQCTEAERRVVVRSFYEDARQAMHERAMADRSWMKRRSALAEHPFGVIKCLMGTPRFLVRGLRKARGELALGVLSFNLKRVTNILGVPTLLKVFKTAPA